MPNPTTSAIGENTNLHQAVSAMNQAEGGLVPTSKINLIDQAKDLVGIQGAVVGSLNHLFARLQPVLSQPSPKDPHNKEKEAVAEPVTLRDYMLHSRSLIKSAMEIINEINDRLEL